MIFKFFLPEKSDIIIFDEAGCDMIMNNIINKSHSHQIVKSRINCIYINPKFIIIFIINLFKFIFSSSNLFSTIYKVYLLTIIKIIKAKVIITFSDNNLIYHWLITAYPNICYIAIQNGIRQKFEVDITKKLTDVVVNHEHYYCFGQYDIDKHNDMGFTIKHPHACGSLRLGLFDQLKVSSVKKYDICLLSNYKKKHRVRKSSITKEIFENNRLLDMNLAKFIKKNDKKLIIALRTIEEEERFYFQKVFGKDALMTTGKTQSFSSYKASIDSEITVAFQSTLLLEMLALDCKILHIDFTNNVDLFDYDVPIKYVFSNYSLFELKLKKLLTMNSLDYTKTISSFKKYIMNQNNSNPPHRLIKKHINNVLGNYE